MLKTLWKKLSGIGAEETGNLYDHHRIVLSNQITCIFMCAILIRMSVNIIKSDFITASITVVIGVAVAFTFILNYFRKHTLARVYLVCIFILLSYVIVVSINKINYGSLFGFYFVELNSLVVYLLLFDRHYDKPFIYHAVFGLVVINIFAHDQFYFWFLEDKSWVYLFERSDSYAYFKLPQLTLAVVLFIGFRLWKKDLHAYREKLEELNIELAGKNDEITAQNEEITAQNEELVLQTDELFRKNELLKSAQEETNFINANLEAIVDQRTQLIRNQNKKLIDYAFYNAHKVRGPLARILGLLHLIKIDRGSNKEEIIMMLGNSAIELDQVVKEINEILKSDESGMMNLEGNDQAVE